jgi:hypothetical protein
MELNRYHEQFQVNKASRRTRPIQLTLDVSDSMLMPKKVISITKTVASRIIPQIYKGILTETGKLTKSAPNTCRNTVLYSDFLKRKEVLA